MVFINAVVATRLSSQWTSLWTNYQLPNGLIKVRRRWGQRHPQGANSGSNGKLKLMLNSKQVPPAPLYKYDKDR
jgi:hypothetical protein